MGNKIDLYELIETLFIGDGRNGNVLAIEQDGTIQAKGTATCYDDDKYPVTASRLDNTSGRIDYNYSENTVDFESNARYPEEPLSIIAQIPHSRRADSDIYPHLHWVQNSATLPNILVEYRWYNNGEAVPAVWQQVAVTDLAFPYSAGSILQISPITTIDGTGKNLSSILDVRIYRDSTNASGLFAGADPLAGVWSLKEFDIHFERDMLGSREEYTK